MRTVWMLAAGYLVVVGAATFYSNSASGTTPTADSIAQLPSIGSLLNSSGTAAASLDIAGAVAIWFFALR